MSKFPKKWLTESRHSPLVAAPGFSQLSCKISCKSRRLYKRYGEICSSILSVWSIVETKSVNTSKPCWQILHCLSSVCSWESVLSTGLILRSIAFFFFVEATTKCRKRPFLVSLSTVSKFFIKLVFRCQAAATFVWRADCSGNDVDIDVVVVMYSVGGWWCCCWC